MNSVMPRFVEQMKDWGFTSKVNRGEGMKMVWTWGDKGGKSILIEEKEK